VVCDECTNNAYTSAASFCEYAIGSIHCICFLYKGEK
jgi:hypothetical protein